MTGQTLLTFGSFILFTGLVALGTWLLTRKKLADTSESYFLAGRSLSAGYIAGSLLLTNLSTEQLVGLNGAAFQDGLSVMAWEVIAAFSLVIMALFFLPRYLKSGIATIPQFLNERFGHTTQTITTVIFLVAYVVIALPMLLYTGATGMNGILDMSELTGIENRTTLLWIMIWVIGIIGSIYAIFGGLRAVAVSDTLNGFGLLVGGILITWLGLHAVNPDGVFPALQELKQAAPEKFNSLGGNDQSVPFSTLFTGVLLLNLFYWCTNQQIIQRAFAATNLAQGQKGVLLAGFFKVLAPLILVLPGIIGFHLYGRIALDGEMTPVKEVTTSSIAVVAVDDQGKETILHGDDAAQAVGGKTPASAKVREGETFSHENKELTVEKLLDRDIVITVDSDGKNRYTNKSELAGKDAAKGEAGQGDADVVSPRIRDTAYGTLVRNVLPKWLAGFFAAVMAGAILSSFNSVLNSSATLFSLGVYKDVLRPNASDHEVVRSGMWFGLVAAIASMLGAPLLANQVSIFAYLQDMNAIYFIPIFAVVLVGMLNRRVPGFAANVSLILGVAVVAAKYFVPWATIAPGVASRLDSIHNFHFLGIVFVSLILLMLVLGAIRPRTTPWEQRDSGEVDLTPWRWAMPAGLVMVVLVLSIYITFADTSVFAAEPAAVAKP
ncbi:MAG: solute:sodium symporter family transporter [Planctomycetaceae bacterium]